MEKISSLFYPLYPAYEQIIYPEENREKILAETKVGSAFEGTVVRKAPFGAFIELAAGVDGLLHVSQLEPGVDLSAIETGSTVSGWIKEINPEDRAIVL